MPVITSTKTDKSAIDLAGVEAGAKIFVPLEDEPFASLAHAAIPDQKSGSIVCVRNRTVEDFLNIDISLLLFSTAVINRHTQLPFSTSETRTSPDLTLSPQRAPQFLID
jgi:hypothetical protein